MSTRTEELQRGTIWYPLEIVGTVSDYVPVECDTIRVALEALDPILESSRWDAGEIEANLFPGQPPLPIPVHEAVTQLATAIAAHPGLALGVHLELLSGGRVVAEGDAWWGVDDSGELTPWGTHIALKWIGQPPSPAGGAPWRLRVVGCPIAALRDFESTSYWKGEVEVPVRWPSATEPGP